MNNLLYQSVRLNCDIHQAFELFRLDRILQLNLTSLSEIASVFDGTYKFFWDHKDKKSYGAFGYQISASKKDRLIALDWIGPIRLNDLTNCFDPHTSAVVSFFPFCQGVLPATEIHLVHTGWGNSAEWNEAGRFFKKTWSLIFAQLRKDIDDFLPKNDREKNVQIHSWICTGRATPPVLIKRTSKFCLLT